MKQIIISMAILLALSCGNKYDETVKESKEQTEKSLDSLDSAQKKQLRHIESVQQLMDAGATKEEAERKVTENEKEIEAI